MARHFRDLGVAVETDRVNKKGAHGPIRAVLLTGERRAFSVGSDLALLNDAQDRSETARAIIAPIHAGIEALHASGVPSVAARRGAVAGGGMSLALCADLAVAAEDVRMSFAHLDIAASPDCRGSWALPRLVGLRKAMEIAFLEPTLSAEAALQLGLVNVVTPSAELAQKARQIASRLAYLPARSAARRSACCADRPARPCPISSPPNSTPSPKGHPSPTSTKAYKPSLTGDRPTSRAPQDPAAKFILSLLARGDALDTPDLSSDLRPEGT